MAKQGTAQGTALRIHTSDRQVEFALIERVALANVIAVQTTDRLQKALGRAVTDEDVAALYSVRRRIKPEDSDLRPYTRVISGTEQIDYTAIRRAGGNPFTATMDGFEARVLKTFLLGWLKAEGSMADRDWAIPILDQCSDL